MTILITNGTVVTAQGSMQADVLVDGETIAAVLAPGSTALGSDLAASAEQVIDATGKRRRPVFATDPHHHQCGPNERSRFVLARSLALWSCTWLKIGRCTLKPSESFLLRRYWQVRSHDENTSAKCRSLWG